jgi:hypothetical protein
MKEICGDMWDYMKDGNVLVITTNGTIKKDGCAVMGRGNAYEAKQRFPGIDQTLGDLLKIFGNHCFILINRPEFKIVSLPVKYSFWEEASLELIERSTQELVELVGHHGFKQIIIARPGCGNGKQSWSMVKAIIEKYLDDRFLVISFGKDSK